MDLVAAELGALALMDKWGLRITTWKWQLQWTNANRQAGQCVRHSRIIWLSRPIVLLNSEQQVFELICHEIAHVFAPDNHGPIWQSVARKMGGDGAAVVRPELIVPAARWVYVCKRCGCRWPRYRKLRGRGHRHGVKCGGIVVGSAAA